MSRTVLERPPKSTAELPVPNRKRPADDLAQPVESRELQPSMPLLPALLFVAGPAALLFSFSAPAGLERSSLTAAAVIFMTLSFRLLTPSKSPSRR